MHREKQKLNMHQAIHIHTTNQFSIHSSGVYRAIINIPISYTLKDNKPQGWMVTQMVPGTDMLPHM